MREEKREKYKMLCWVWKTIDFKVLSWISKNIPYFIFRRDPYRWSRKKLLDCTRISVDWSTSDLSYLSRIWPIKFDSAERQGQLKRTIVFSKHIRIIASNTGDGVFVIVFGVWSIENEWPFPNKISRVYCYNLHQQHDWSLSIMIRNGYIACKDRWMTIKNSNWVYRSRTKRIGCATQRMTAAGVV